MIQSQGWKVEKVSFITDARSVDKQDHTEVMFETDTRERNGKDLKEGRQNVVVVLTRETGEHFDVEKINTWVRNHKNE